MLSDIHYIEWMERGSRRSLNFYTKKSCSFPSSEFAFSGIKDYLQLYSQHILILTYTHSFIWEELTNLWMSWSEKYFPVSSTSMMENFPLQWHFLLDFFCYSTSNNILENSSLNFLAVYGREIICHNFKWQLQTCWIDI